MFDLVIIEARRSNHAPVLEPKCWSDLALSYIISWSDSAEKWGGLVDGIPLLYESVNIEIGEGYSIEISLLGNSCAISLIYGPAMSGRALCNKRGSTKELLAWLGNMITCTSFSLFMAGFDESHLDDYPMSEYLKAWWFSR